MIQIDRLEGLDRVRVTVREGDFRYQVDMESPDISRAIVSIKESVLVRICAALEETNKEHIADLLRQKEADMEFVEVKPIDTERIAAALRKKEDEDV